MTVAILSQCPDRQQQILDDLSRDSLLNYIGLLCRMLPSPPPLPRDMRMDDGAEEAALMRAVDPHGLVEEIEAMLYGPLRPRAPRRWPGAARRDRSA